MSNPFPLSNADAQAFYNSVGVGTLDSLPDWGGIVQWNTRFVLVYPLPNRGYFFPSYTDFAYTDVTGGIPNNGMLIPVNVYIQDVPTQQTSSYAAFLYALPQNFMAVTLERYRQMVNVAETVTGDVGAVVGQTVNSALSPLGGSIWPIAIIGVAALYFLYAPKPKRV